MPRWHANTALTRRLGAPRHRDRSPRGSGASSRKVNAPVYQRFPPPQTATQSTSCPEASHHEPTSPVLRPLVIHRGRSVRSECADRSARPACRVGNRTVGGYEKGPGCRSRPGPFVREDSEVHAAHATGRVARGCAGLLRLVGDDRLGGEEQRGDGRRVLQRRAGDLDRVGDAGRQQILVSPTRVQAVARGKVRTFSATTPGSSRR